MSLGHRLVFQQSPTPTASGDPTPTTGLIEAVLSVLPFGLPPWVIQLLSTAIILGVAWGVSRLAVAIFGRRVAQWFTRPSLTRMALRGIRLTIYLFALVSILGVWGIRISDIGLSVAVFSAIVGVVVAPIVGSFVSGMFLLADQPYEIGDMIELADTGQRGFVDDITLRHTKMFTLDNTFLVIPNGEIRSRDVINYSAEDQRTRLALDVLVTYESDIEEARTIITRAARQVDVVIDGGPDIRIGEARYPAAPTVYINEYADDGVLLTLRYWVTEPYKLLAARSKVQTELWTRLADSDVEIAYPHTHLYFDETSGAMELSMTDSDSINERISTQPPSAEGE